jgi:large subunit ribosomal protein L13
MNQKTFYPKESEINREWVLVDAEGQNLGRLATQIATILLGKNKPEFTPGVDIGDYVVVTNCEKIVVTGNKLEDKMYYHHTGYPGGIKSKSLRQVLEKNPNRVIEAAVWGMLPHNKYGRKVLKKLHAYAGDQHPHVGQQPKPLVLD